MRLTTQSLRAPKIREKRRGNRLNSRVPVILEWEEAGGASAREETFTRVIGPYGCMVVLPRVLPVGQHLDVVNLATQSKNPGVVVWTGGEERGEEPEWELGIELTQPMMNFWGCEL